MSRAFTVTEEEFKVIADIRKVFEKKDHKMHHVNVKPDKNGKLQVYDVNMTKVS